MGDGFANFFGLASTDEVDEIYSKINRLNSIIRDLNNSLPGKFKALQEQLNSVKILQDTNRIELQEFKKQVNGIIQDIDKKIESSADDVKKQMMKILDEHIKELKEFKTETSAKLTEHADSIQQNAERIQQTAENVQQLSDVHAQLNTALIAVALIAVVCVSAILIYSYMQEKSYKQHVENDYQDVERYDQSDGPSPYLSETDRTDNHVPALAEEASQTRN